MRVRADFHIHSKFSRATSKEMVPEKIAQWAKIKGIDLIGSGDSTHPGWLEILERSLTETAPGIYQLKSGQYPEVSFIVSSEISTIFSRQVKGEKKSYRQHIVVLLPGIKSAKKVNRRLSWEGNLKSDGRPILGMDCQDLIKLILTEEPEALIIPAHIWTPWFSLFGAKSGFDSIKEAYGSLTSEIVGLETGLSSDIPMNRLISELDDYTLLSNSDAHSPKNIGRETNVFELDKLSYQKLGEAIKDKERGRLKYTIEFYPQEGKYHYDGHRKCGICWSPEETKKHNYLCPVCGKRVTVGVMHRVMELADRRKPELRGTKFKSLIPLPEIIASQEGVGKSSQAVQVKYYEIIQQIGSELDILEGKKDRLLAVNYPDIYQAVMAMKDGQVDIKEGFDGQYGQISVKVKPVKKQAQLF